MSRDRAGRDHWDRTWTQPITEINDPRNPDSRNYVNHAFHLFFRDKLAPMMGTRRTLLEVGCGRSYWLPYFADEFGLSVTGIDYSETGCDQARAILKARGIEGKVMCGDLFSPPRWMIGTFGLLLSYGVLEHFDDTREALLACANLLAQTGLIVTIIPNMREVTGLLQKLFNRPVYDMHVPLTRKDLLSAHKGAGLVVDYCSYFLFTNFGVINLTGLPSGRITKVKERFLVFLTRVSKAVWLVETNFFRLPPNRLTSPYLVCIAKRVSARGSGVQGTG